MGGIFRLPFRVAEDLLEEARGLRAQDYALYAAHLKGQEAFDRTVYPARCAFMLGNEGSGLSEELTALADNLIRIPMEGQAESLNVAVAGALLLYEVYKQRRAQGRLTAAHPEKVIT